VLTAAGKVPPAASDAVVFFGELGLDGGLRPVRGVLPSIVAAAERGFGTVMVAEQNAPEAALVPGVRVIAASSLTGAADWLRGTPGPRGGPPAAEFKRRPGSRSEPGRGPAVRHCGCRRPAHSRRPVRRDLARPR
jgi:magnesium chelatase family protein